MGDPPALVLDEPTVGLDPAQIVDLRERIAGLARDHAVILSTHILPEASRLCSKVLILNRGRRVAYDEVSELTGLAAADEVEILVSGSASTDSLWAASPFTLRGATLDSRGTRLRIGLEEGARVADAVAILVGAGHGVEEDAASQAGLEEVFLDLVHEDPARREATT